MNVIDLPGCTPEPLMSYLKALGVFRLVAEQADPGATMSWHGGACRLYTTLDRDSLTEFFIAKYQPTPVLAPWNGGGGFYGGGSAPLEAIAGSTAGRLALYRESIAIARAFVTSEKPKDERKDTLLRLCRAYLPDKVVPWLDACFVLGEVGPSFFPLLGTGGNDGRLDFTNNFMQRLADILAFSEEGPPADSGRLLASALLADSLVPLRKTAVGQFNPGSVGGANGTQGSFEADSRVNPWEYVLMIEGTMLFAGSVARRLGTNADNQRAAFPFCVEGLGVGHGSFSEKEARVQGPEPPNSGELWLPLWSRPITLAELTYLFAEGRAQFRRKQARNSVEFSLAVKLLGVNRGIDAFTRYDFLRRNGKAFLAPAVGRVVVTPRPDARLLADTVLTAWLDKLRNECRENDGKREKIPARYKAALRQVDRAMYEFASRNDHVDRRDLAGVLVTLGRAERALATGLSFCEEHFIRPIQGLGPDWLLIAKDGGEEWREFRLASSLASVLAEPDAEVGPIRAHLEPVIRSRRANSRVEWRAGSTSAVWTDRPLADNLAAVFLRRFMESGRSKVAGVALRARVYAPLADVLGFLADLPGAERDQRDARVADLLWGLIAIRWDGNWFKSSKNRRRLREAILPSRPLQPRTPDVAPRAYLPWEFGMIRLVAQRVGFVADGPGRFRVARPLEKPILSTTPIVEPFHRLARGVDPMGDSLGNAVTFARRRLWADQFPLARRFQQNDTRPDLALDPRRLIAACLFPLSPTDKARLLRVILPRPERDKK